MRHLHLESPEFPSLLRQIPDPPPSLYVQGTLPANMRAVACVGTRNPTRWGQIVTQRIVRELVAHGYTIVSGLALGIDAIAHQAALDAGGHTVAVLPCGLEQLYPKQHRHLAERILASGGALVSPFAPGSRLYRSNFIHRNRSISGLSLATVIMQCAPSSGTFHTARAAQKQGRLLCVTQPQGRYAQEPQSHGNLELLKKPEIQTLRSAADYPELLQLLASLDLPT